MHMADALVSPEVGGTMWVASAAAIGFASRKLNAGNDDRIVPLMAVMGAFVFAAQMINFTIPATGSSGHLGGGLLLAAMLGPHGAVLAISSVLFIQALFFADGGLLALGCNIFNLGVFPAYIAYPLIFKPLAGLTGAGGVRSGRVMAASIIAALIGLELGAFAVVVQTTASGITALSPGEFLMLMLPIHGAIGIVEGVVTALVLTFVVTARPEIIAGARSASPARLGFKAVLGILGVAAVLTGGVVSLAASSHPDGLEWSVERVAGTAEIESPDTGPHRTADTVQKKVAALPDYSLPGRDGHAVGTSLSGIVGGFMTLVLAAVIGMALSRRRV